MQACRTMQILVCVCVCVCMGVCGCVLGWENRAHIEMHISRVWNMPSLPSSDLYAKSIRLTHYPPALALVTPSVWTLSG